jgi:type I restriction enzyme S subunit
MMTESTVTIPSAGVENGWAPTLLDDLVASDAPICYGILKPGTHDENGIRVVKVRDIGKDGIELERLMKVSPAIERQYKRSRLQPGDLLLTIRGSVGAVATVPDGLSGGNITQDTARIRLKDGIDRDFVRLALSSTQVQRFIRDHTVGQAVKGINVRDVRRIPLPLPPLPVQRRIVDALILLELGSRRLNSLLELKRRFKRGVAQQLCSELGTRSPVVRLGKHTLELTARNRLGVGRDRVMGVIKGVGLVPMRERIRVGDLARYKDVPPDAFAYNPMRINIGSIARNRSDIACLVSPDYVVFQTDPRALLPAYLDQLRHTGLWQSHLDGAGAGGVRIRIYFRDLAKIRVPLPSLEEQRRIANLLDFLDDEIATLARLADAYERLRSAMLDKLLSGEIPIPAS